MLNAQGRARGTRTANLWVAVGFGSAVLAGCTTAPADYAATLSAQDPKWTSAECQQIRAEASTYKQRKVSWAGGLLLGPYGLALAAAGKEHQEKQRIQFARELHLRCSSQPLPKKLQNNQTTAQRRG